MASTTHGFCDLDGVGTTRSYAYDEATLLQPGRYTARSPTTSKTFTKNFFAHYPILKKMDWSNIAVRGGAVVAGGARGGEEPRPAGRAEERLGCGKRHRPMVAVSGRP